MKIPLYQLDAFTRTAFGGNPAAVCPLECWLDDGLLQAIAAENNLAETAFYVSENGSYRLRWFTPVAEVPLCGHATLATGHLILNVLEPGRERIRFETLSGPVEVARDGERLTLDFPALPLKRELDPDLVADAIGVRPDALWEADRGMAVLSDAAAVRELRPDVGRVAELPFRSLIVTARGFEGDCDFVSRFFAPKLGIAEDPVTGSAHCVLTPYWSGVLRKPSLFARQLSPRGGELWVEDRGARVRLSGDCVLVIEGSFAIP
ncbi:MAG: PhzF family phenazine biosynthesis protein [Candidatus Eremiobacteraeota bacterium]|nr:PhzF family phenazine biosynthesis protein [Candidatus Eremiobacteraeota bacterium]MBV8498486.1 PhzF family phenazine biosynthesis protein [Candidatus Eremiobacteraeota bacterium]